jgi:hypothetical protein
MATMHSYKLGFHTTRRDEKEQNLTFADAATAAVRFFSISACSAVFTAISATRSVLSCSASS